MTAAEVIARAIDPGAWGDCDDNPTVRHARSRHQQDAREQAAAILAALRGAGFAVVPREATSAMTLEANKRVSICTPDGTWSIGRDEAGRTWRAMVAAAEPRTQVAER